MNARTMDGKAFMTYGAQRNFTVIGGRWSDAKTGEAIAPGTQPRRSPFAPRNADSTLLPWTTHEPQPSHF